MFLSINSIKTYISSAYRKIGVARRTQAVLWGMSNGFEADIERTIDALLKKRPSPRPTVVTQHLAGYRGVGARVSASRSASS